MNEEDRDFYKGLKTDARELLSFYLKPFLLFWKTLLLLWKLLPFFLVILFFLLSGVTIYWMWEAFVFEKMAERLNFENSPSAFVIFSKGDSPSTLSVRVLDMKGNPSLRNMWGYTAEMVRVDGALAETQTPREGPFRGQELQL
jgi:hypothetical protein